MPARSSNRAAEAALEEEIGQEKPEKFNLGDTAGLKRAVDDAVLEAAAAAGYAVDYRSVDAKIFVGLLACAVACVGQFYPGKYPATAPVLVACVAVYAALSLLLTLLATHVEKEAIAFTLPPAGRRGGAALAISSRMPRFQDKYTLRVAAKDGRAGEVSQARSVAAYFDRDGYLAKEVVIADATRLLQQFEASVGGQAGAEAKKEQ